MPLVSFNTKTFKGEPVDCGTDARRRADFNYKLNNIQKMELSNEELTAIIHRDHLLALCAENCKQAKTPRTTY